MAVISPVNLRGLWTSVCSFKKALNSRKFGGALVETRAFTNKSLQSGAAFDGTEARPRARDSKAACSKP
jgi:hypothetical protein